MSVFNVDTLILGSGIAGLTIAIKTARALPNNNVYVITKANESESNTKYAQGGIAAVWHKLDSFRDHINDTLVAGDYLGDPDIVKLVVEKAPSSMKELMEWGAEFDQDSNGELDLGKEGGHSANRILHHKDITGFEVEKTLLDQVKLLSNITLLSYHFAIDLITDHHLKNDELIENISCYGAYVLNQKTNKIDTYKASTVVLATGGVGQVYASTTNPTVATGDGIAMAYRAKAKIEDMEFVQFHPTSLYQPGESPAFLISEAVRGFGAYLKNKAGERFMLKVDERGELAPRDIVSRAIDSELIRSGDQHVYLDCTHLDMEGFINHFPNIYEKCKSIGVDIRNQKIPVVPAAHYLMGGIVVDQRGYSTIGNLFACGECSRTGLHGANRLASNSLLEALVFGNEIANEIIKNRGDLNFDENLLIPEWNEDGTMIPKEKVLITHNRKTIQAIMTDLVAIVRSDERLDKALDHLDYLFQDMEKAYAKSKLSPQICELRNLNTISYLIVSQSKARKVNKGAFYSLNNL